MVCSTHQYSLVRMVYTPAVFQPQESYLESTIKSYNPIMRGQYQGNELFNQLRNYTQNYKPQQEYQRFPQQQNTLPPITQSAPIKIKEEQKSEPERELWRMPINIPRQNLIYNPPLLYQPKSREEKTDCLDSEKLSLMIQTELEELKPRLELMN